MGWVGRFVLGTVVLLSVFGCGYRFASEGLGPEPTIATVAIPVFENLTAEPGLEPIFTGALRREFMLRSEIRVVPRREADAVFLGRIVRLTTSDVAHRESQNTTLTRLLVTLDIRCVDQRSGAVIWQDRSLTYYQDYLQDVDPLIGFQNRREALRRIARDLAVRIHDRFLSRF